MITTRYYKWKENERNPMEKGRERPKKGANINFGTVSERCLNSVCMLQTVVQQEKRKQSPRLVKLYAMVMRKDKKRNDRSTVQLK